MQPHLDADLRRALTAHEAAYDPAERMLVRPFSSPGYHTALTGGDVHPTRESLVYALALLDSGEEADRERAAAILDRVLALQDTEPSSPTYGIWSWFLEEPLSAMSPPDWNWADFCGSALIQVLMDHGDRLDPGLTQRLDDAVCHAARSIQRRDVGPDYTNIALMGAYVTYAVGEFCERPDLLAYARKRLQRFVGHTKATGAFTEFNSPTYSVVALRVLARMRRDIRDAEAHPDLAWLYDLAWRDVARHFHPPTAQWAGPHSRAYSTLLRPDTQAFLQRATRGELRLLADGELPPDLEAHRLDVPCPPDHVPLLLRPGGERDIVQVYHPGGGRAPRVIGRTYMDQTVALGTTNRGDFWNQRRPLIGYWGDRERPIALRVRCLHDDYDYCSGLIFARQAGPYVLAAVVFATDHGDTHPGLDPIRDQATVARDLRLSLEIVNPPAAWDPPDPPGLDEPRSLAIGKATLGLHLAHAEFGDLSPRVETRRTEEGVAIDVVLYHGEERRVDFGRMEAAAVVFGLQLTPTSLRVSPPSVRVARQGSRLAAEWDTPRGTLELVAPERPGPFAEIQDRVDGVDDA